MLRISRDRVWLYGGALAILNFAVPICVWIRGYFLDWEVFLTAGATVGSRMLLNPFLWQRAHHFVPAPFVYTPGFAWVYLPLAHATLLEGALINAAAIVVTGIVCGIIAGKLYGVPRPLAILAIFAWAPVGAALLEDQNSVLGLLLVFIAVAGFCGRSLRFTKYPYSITGVAVGLLLYKPQYALPWIVFLLFRREWRTLFVIALCSLVWYFLSFMATGMDPSWTAHWLAVIRGYAGKDFWYNADKTIALPGFLQRVGIPSIAALGLGGAFFVYAAYKMRNLPSLQVASFIPLLGLACSPHAWDYDAVLALPAIFWVLTRVAEPLRTKLIILAYAIAPLWIVSHFFRVDALALVTIGGVILWLCGYMRDGTIAHTQQLSRS